MFDTSDYFVNRVKIFVNANEFGGSSREVDFGTASLKNLVGKRFQSLLSGGHRQRLLLGLVRKVEVF